MDDVITRKAVGALVRDAEVGFAAEYVMGKTAAAVTDVVLRGFKKAMGGLWVGGHATLHETHVVFQPNALNKKVHAEDYTLTIPLMSISDIKVRFGVVTKIIDLVTDHGTLSIRCYGAKAFAETIRQQRDFRQQNG